MEALIIDRDEAGREQTVAALTDLGLSCTARADAARALALAASRGFDLIATEWAAGWRRTPGARTARLGRQPHHAARRGGGPHPQRRRGCSSACSATVRAS